MSRTHTTFRWEWELSDSFCANVRHFFTREGTATRRVLESTCSDGRADLVCARFVTNARLAFLRHRADLLVRPLPSRILASLSSDVPRTYEELLTATGVTSPTLRRTMEVLADAKLVIPDDDRYHLAQQARLPEVEIDSFEFKLSNWRRALYQATRYRCFSHRVYVVLPPEAIPAARSSKGAFEKLNVGMLLHDEDGYSEQIVRPKKKAPASRQRVYMAVGQILGGKPAQQTMAG